MSSDALQRIGFRLPDAPVAAPAKHEPLMTPIADQWLVWCACGWHRSRDTWDLALVERKRHKPSLLA